MPRSHSPDSQRSRHLPGGAEPIAESDYFLKSSEFRVWLKEEKHKVPLEPSIDHLSMLKCFLSTSMNFQARKHEGELTRQLIRASLIFTRYFHKFVKVRHRAIADRHVAHHLQ